MDGGDWSGGRCVVRRIHCFRISRVLFGCFGRRTGTVHVRPEGQRALFVQAQLDDRSCAGRIDLCFNDTEVGINVLEELKSPALRR